MGWIKRNLFFVIGGVVALGLLGAGGFYIYQGWARNAAAADKLNEIYGALRSLQSDKNSPGNDKIDNTRIAKEQQRQLQEWVNSANAFIQSVPPIPDGDLTSKNFATALGSAIYQLQQEAKSASVTLPPKYAFSFDAEDNKLSISPASLDPLAVQLGEIKAIAETVFSARVNALDGIQRVRVSDEDSSGPAGDYIDDHPVVSDLAVITPYVVTFRCFTPELARVIGAFATSSNTFLIKAINLQTAGVAAAAPAGGIVSPWPMPGQAMPASTLQGKGGLQTVLKEQLLRVSMQLEFVKRLPKN
jgi:hypothetical protein